MKNTFDLKQFKQGVPAYTRDGRKATFVGICAECQHEYQLLAHVDGNPVAVSFLLTGELRSTGLRHGNDLVRMEGPYDHISQGDLVVVWVDDYNQTHAFVRLARLGKFAGYDGKHALASTAMNKNPTPWDNCLTVEEYAEKYL